MVESSGAGAGQQLPLLGLAGAGTPGGADNVHLGAAVRVFRKQVREADVVAGGEAERHAAELERDGFGAGVDRVRFGEAESVEEMDLVVAGLHARAGDQQGVAHLARAPSPEAAPG